MKNLIIIRKIETIRYLTNEFVILNIYISELINSKIEMIKIIVKVHLIHNLKIKLLIDIDILNSEKINISFYNHFLIINSKDKWEIKIHIHAKNNICIYQKIQALKKLIILSYFFLTILIKLKSALFINQNFLFVLTYFNTHIYLIDADMQFIHVWNDSDWSIHIFLKNDLEKIIKIKEEQCYYVDSNSHNLTAQKSAKNSKSNTLKSDKTNQVSIDSFVVLSTINNISKSIFQQNFRVLLNIINKNVSISFKIQIY